VFLTTGYVVFGATNVRTVVTWNHMNQIVMELTGTSEVAVTKLPEFPVKSWTSPTAPQ
jgi:hypothetical protein